MKTVKKYVVGFMFRGDKVLLLIKKHGPSFMIGKWNGIGGKIETTDFLPSSAMVREFEEETGIQTKQHDWTQFALIQDKKMEAYSVCAFVAHWRDYFGEPKATTDETPCWVDYESLLLSECRQMHVPNLSWLIPLALTKGSFAQVYENNTEL